MSDLLLAMLERAEKIVDAWDEARAVNAEVLAALRVLADNVADALPELNNVCVFAAVHGYKYTGPQIDVLAARAAIAKAEGR